MFKEKIKRIRELTWEIECKYDAYAWSGGIPDEDEEISSWKKERNQILNELENELESKEVEEK